MQAKEINQPSSGLGVASSLPRLPPSSFDCPVVTGLWLAFVVCLVPAIVLLADTAKLSVGSLGKSVAGTFLATLALLLLVFAVALQNDKPLQAILTTGQFTGLSQDDGYQRCVAHARRVSFYGWLGIAFLVLWVGIFLGILMTIPMASWDPLLVFWYTAVCICPAIFVLSVTAILVGCISSVTPAHALFFPGFYRLLTHRVYLFSLPLLIAHFAAMFIFFFAIAWTGAFNLGLAVAVFIRLRFVIPRTPAPPIDREPSPAAAFESARDLEEGGATAQTRSSVQLVASSSAVPSAPVPGPSQSGRLLVS